MAAMIMLMMIFTAVGNITECFVVAVKLLKSGCERNEMVIKTDFMVMNWRFFAAVCANNNKFGR